MGYLVGLFEKRGCGGLRMVALPCAPERVLRRRGAHGDVRIAAGAPGRGRDANGRIRPDLGDAVDRLCRTQRQPR